MHTDVYLQYIVIERVDEIQSGRYYLKVKSNYEMHTSSVNFRAGL